MNFSYRNRVVDEILQRKLKSSGAVLIEGPKWCGKTTTAEHFSKSINYVSEPSVLNKNLILAEMDINKLLDGEQPRLLDEWQVIPQLWDAVRFYVDHNKGMGQFILTGSASPLTKNEREKIHHTGTGRFSRLMMRPMSLWESGESNGMVSLSSLFKQNNFSTIPECHLLLEDLAYLICRGGWPITVSLDETDSLETAISYYDSIVEVDMSRIDDVHRSQVRVKRLMRSLARYQGAQATIASIKKDIQSNDVDTLSEDTVSSYIDLLKKLFVVDDMEAWNPNLRSKAAIRTSDTRYFIDPSIATAALGVCPNDLVNDINTMGLLFETLAVRDLRVYASVNGGNVYHYRDSNGLECDAVIHLKDGNYGLVEIKLGGEKLIEDGAKTLNKFDVILDTDRMPSPSFKMILTGVGSMAYKRSDGIFVVPIGCLKQ